MRKHLNLSDLFVIFKCLSKNCFTTFFVIISLSMILCSCATNRVISIPVSTELISKTRITKPIVKNKILVNVRENLQIEPVYKLEESIGEALKSALNYSNIFGQDPSKPFEIVVDIISWYQPPADIGMFGCIMKTHYVLRDEEKNIILDQIINTEASSDIWYFAGYKRSMRAATVTVAKNVNQFIDILKTTVEAKNNNAVKEEIFSSDKQQLINTNRSESNNKTDLSEELKKLSELHSSGILTDEEFQKAKNKILNQR